jgi:uncharacterized protein DUF6527
MSAAEVLFLTLAGDPCPPGEKPARFTFRCVGANRGRDPRVPRSHCAKLLIAEGPHSAAHGVKRNGRNQDGGRAQWDWDGNRDAPTLAPSVNCESACGWHGYIRAGRCVSQAGADEPG